MTEFRVTWEIDIEAETPKQAAEQAFAIQQDPETMATVFAMTDPAGVTTEIDLLDDPDWELVTTRVPPWAKVDNNLDIETVILLARDLAKYMPLCDSYNDYVRWIKNLAYEFMEDHMDLTGWDKVEYWKALNTFEEWAVHHLVHGDRRRPEESP
jgi:hypothetical protein